MDVLTLSALVVVVTALFSYLNHRFLRLPTVIGVMAISLVFSIAVVLLGQLGVGYADQAEGLLASIDFDRALLEGMLGFLLFAGALHVNLDDLLAQKWVITILATVGVVVSCLLVAWLVWLVSGWLGLGLKTIHCLLFGALIAPTDPIAVLGIMKRAGAPKTLETKIAGESLFNDGVGVVLFLVLLEAATGEAELHLLEVARFFAWEAVGGALLGLVLGWICYHMLKQVDQPQVEVLLTLALVMGGYVLASALHTSGPILVVVAGLLIGNHGRTYAMSEKTRERLDTFWELVDEILNAVLFVLIGLELVLIAWSGRVILAGVLAIPIVLFARFVSVGGAVAVMRLWRQFSPAAVRVMTWGGLRGGISVALALSLPRGPERDTVLAIAYAVVVFSILVQGMTIGVLVRRNLHA